MVEKCHETALIGVRLMMDCHVAELRRVRKLKENRENCEERDVHATALRTHVTNRIGM